MDLTKLTALSKTADSTGGTVRPVPQLRIMEKLDEYMALTDFEGAGRHLLYWLEEAVLGHDLRGELMIRQELIGHFRKIGDRENAFLQAREILRLLKEMDYEDSLSAGTAYVNIGTAYNAFGENERSLEMFEKARAIYEAHETVSPSLLGGLYNNMALACADMGAYDSAFSRFSQALEQMARVPGGSLEQAITCLNMADALEKQLGPERAQEKIDPLLEKAERLLEDPEPVRDGYYAWVCDKCAPVFDYYGWFAAAAALREHAGQIRQAIREGE